jgi:hypothetical protein
MAAFISRAVPADAQRVVIDPVDHQLSLPEAAVTVHSCDGEHRRLRDAQGSKRAADRSRREIGLGASLQSDKSSD